MQMDFKNMNDSELALKMVNYIKCVAYLKDLIARYLDGSNCNHIDLQQIKDLYKQLKNELHKDAKYLSLACNKKGSTLYTAFFAPSIKEASACGFKVPVNHPIDYEMFNAVYIAHCNLTDYYDLDEWENLI